MINYYEILGLGYGAGIPEIKAAFRHLAKLYHPDKNPDGIEHFTKILKAYETLSDPVLKASYDYKLNYHQAQAQYESKTTAPTKTWKFDERELKRRQYYNDHIKKYAKQTSEYMADAETKKNYNEFKYILFATPLAVILFLLIMHFASKDRKEFIQADSSSASIQAEAKVLAAEVSDLKLGYAPYTITFGEPIYVKKDYATVTVKNLSGKEVVICLFTKKEFVRCFYMTDNVSAEVTQLPKEPLFIYYYSGLIFNSSLPLKEISGAGRFKKDEQFYRSNKATALNALNELTLVSGTNEGFEKINEKEFFKYAKK